MLLPAPPLSNAERQRRFQADHPGYDRRRKARYRAVLKRATAKERMRWLAQAQEELAERRRAAAAAERAKAAARAPAAKIPLALPAPPVRLMLPAPAIVAEIPGMNVLIPRPALALRTAA